MTKVYFIRHGQSLANVAHRFAGHSDFPLSELGHAQAACTAKHVMAVPFTAVYASDLSRAADTGAAVARIKDLPLLTRQGLREIYAGEWEGRTFEELADNDDFRLWRQQIGLSRCTGGESVRQLQERVRMTVDDIVKTHPGETICIATHATPIRVLECLWTGVSLEHMHTIPWVSNASVTVAEYDENRVGRLISRDGHAHLGALSSDLPANV